MKIQLHIFLFTALFSWGLSVLVSLPNQAEAQNIGINTTGNAPDASAMLDISSTSQGMLVPRMTNAQRQTLKDPATGLIIYNTTTNEINFYNGTNWQAIQKNNVSVTSALGTGPGLGIGINTTGNSVDPSAMLDVSGTDKGLLIPRTTTGSVTPTIGLIIYNTTTNNINYYNGTSWQAACTGTIDNIKGTGATALGIAINSSGNTPDVSAILDISSATKGLLIPRMTSAQRDAIQTPAQGLIIYNITDGRIENWVGTAWYDWSYTSCCSNAWNQKANFGGVARGLAVGFSIGTKGYAGTGGDASAQQDFWEWDQPTNVWTQKANFGGAARYYATGFSIGTKGYIGNGINAGTHYQDFWEWDQSTNVWVQKTNFGGTARYSPAAFSIGTKGYIGTGINGVTRYQDFWEWDQATDTWTQKANFGGSARYGCTAFSIGTKGYIGTGYDFAYLNDFWEWNQAINTWTQKSNFSGAIRIHASGFAIGTKGYIGTGQQGTGVHYNDFYEYDPAADSWTQKTNFGGTARMTCFGFSVGTKGYIGTGWDGAYKQDMWEFCPTGCPVPAPPVADAVTCGFNGSSFTINITAVGSTTSYLDVATDAGFTSFVSGYNNLNIGTAITYNITGLSPGTTYYVRLRGANLCGTSESSTGITISTCSNSWCEKTNFGGVVRERVGVSFSIGTKGYIGTGRDASGSTYYKDFWEWDQTTNTWTQKADFGGTARQGACGFSIDTKGYLGTGYDLSPSVKNDFWEWDQPTNTWTQKANFGGTARVSASAFSIGKKGYIGVGYDGAVKNDFWEYDPLSNTWTQKANFIGPARYLASGFSISHKGYIGTGYNAVATSYQDFYEWDQTNNTWTAKTNFGGTVRHSAVGFSVGTKGYIGTGNDGVMKQDFWEFSSTGNSWTQVANFGGSARQDATGFAIGTKGYIGTGDPNADAGAVTKDFWEYCPTTCPVPAAPVVEPITCGFNGTSLNLIWTAIGSTTSYLDVATDAGFTSFVTGYNNLNVGGVTNYTITGLTAGTTYYIRVRGGNACGTSSNSVTITVGTCSDSWCQKANFGGTARWAAVGFSIGTKGYIGTGEPGPYKDFWEWDQATNVWTQKADFGGTATKWGVGFSIGTKGYIGTGINSPNEFWEWNQTTNTWTQKANFGGTGRSGAVGFSIGLKGYIGIGGIPGMTQDFWEWNQATNVWTQKANYGGAAKYRAVGFSISTKGYIGPGWAGGAFDNGFWEYDPVGNNWVQKLNYPGAAGEAPVGFSIGTKGYVGTGWNGVNKKDFWEWDQALNTWTVKTPFGGTAREGAVGFSIGTKGYVGTGHDGAGTSDFWEYCPTTCPIPAPPVAEAISCGFNGTSFTAIWTAVGSTNSFLDVATDAGFTSLVFGYNNLNVGSATTYTVSGLTLGTTYYYRVRGSNSCGTSANSSIITVASCSDSWCQKTNFGGVTRSNGTGFSIGNKGYIGTGNGYLQDIWEWDQTTNVWTQKANFGGTARREAVGFSIGTRGYIGTGYDGGYKKDFWEYDQATNTWIQKADFGGTARYNAVGFSIGTKGYIGTGLDGGYTQDFWEWDQSTNVWVQKANFGGIGRYYAAGFSIGNKGYIGTGRNVGTDYVDFWEWDQVTNVWTQKTNFGGSARLYTVSFSIGTKGYIATGGIPAVYQQDIWEYNPTGDSWTQRTNFTGGLRAAAVGFSIGMKGYLGTGTDGALKQDFWEYCPPTCPIPAAPVTTAATNITATTFDANWTSLIATTCYLDVATDAGFTSYVSGYSNLDVGNVTTYGVTGLTAGTTYYYRVRAANSCGTGGNSITIIVAPCTNAWTQKANFGGTARRGAVSFSIGNKGYVGVGYDSGYTQDFWEWDQTTNSWTQKANFGGAARASSVGFSIGTKGYIGTGQNGGTLYQDFWEWNQLTNIWTQKANFGGDARHAAKGFSIGNKGYIGTGFNGAVLKQDFWEYDPSTNSWTQKANFGGSARREAACFTIGNKGYIGTGLDAGLKQDFWEWDQTTNLWTQKANFGGSARQYASAFSLGTKGYIGTGDDGTGTQDFWEWDQSINVWTQKTNFGGNARWVSIGFSIGTKGYFGLGYDGVNYQDFWEYCPTTCLVPAPPVPESISCGFNGTSFIANWTAIGTTTIYLDVATDIAFNSFLSGYNNLNVGNVNNYTITGLNSGSTYYYRIRGANTCGSSTNSSTITVGACSDCWTQKANFGGTGRQAATAFSIGSKGYIGTGNDGALKQDFWEWDQPTNTWTQKASFPGTARWGSTSFSIGTKGYIGTGNDGANKQDFWEWDQPSNTWTQKAIFGGVARWLAVGFSIGAKGYIGTGTDGTFKQDFWEWDQPSNTWTQKANFGGTARDQAVGFSIGTKGYIGPGEDPAATQDFWEWDQASNTWSQKANFGGVGRWSAVGFSIGTKGYIGTGSNGTLKQDFWEWDQASNIWTLKANFGGTARRNAVGFSIGTKGYIGTGYDGSNRQDFWEYCPTTCTTEPDAPVAQPITCGFNGTAITAFWTANGSTSVYLDVATDIGFTTYVAGYNNLNVGNFNNYTITGLSNGTTYYYRLRGVNTCGTSANSNVITISPSNFTDPFTSDLGWVTTDATTMDVDLGAQNMKANYEGGSSNRCIVYDLGAGNVSDNQWVLRFDWTPGTETGADDEGFWGISSNDQTAGNATSQDFIGNCFLYQYTVDATQNGLYECEADNTTLPPTSNGKIQFQWAIGTTYYIELVRLSATSFKYTIYSDAGFSNVIGTQTTAIASTVNSLRYIKFVNYATAATIMNSRVDNVKFWNNQTSVCQ